MCFAVYLCLCGAILATNCLCVGDYCYVASGGLLHLLLLCLWCLLLLVCVHEIGLRVVLLFLRLGIYDLLFRCLIVLWQVVLVFWLRVIFRVFSYCVYVYCGFGVCSYLVRDFCLWFVGLLLDYRLLIVACVFWFGYDWFGDFVVCM